MRCGFSIPYRTGAFICGSITGVVSLIGECTRKIQDSLELRMIVGLRQELDVILSFTVRLEQRNNSLERTIFPRTEDRDARKSQA